MATQIVMDQTGDTRHEFDPENAEALARAEQRFRELTGAGFTARTPTAPREPAQRRRLRRLSGRRASAGNAKSVLQPILRDGHGAR